MNNVASFELEGREQVADPVVEKQKKVEDSPKKQERWRELLEKISFWRRKANEEGKPDEVIEEVAEIDFNDEEKASVSSKVKTEPNGKNVVEGQEMVDQEPVVDSEKLVSGEGVKKVIKEEETVEVKKEVRVPPAAYPEADLGEQDLTEAQIAESVDNYLKWRREHENKEGVLEPGRAEVLAHATSPEGAMAMLKDGYFRSIFNLICTPGKRVDGMVGGKAKFVVGAVERLIKSDSELQKLILERREDLVENLSWIGDGNVEELKLAENIDELMSGVGILVEYAVKRGALGVEWRGNIGRKKEWLCAIKLLPEEARRKIAEESDAEPYVCLALGHAIEAYTPDRLDPSKQAAILLNTKDYSDEQGNPGDSLYTGGGTNDFVQMKQRPKWWNEAIRGIKEDPSKIFTTEYGSGALEINVSQSDPDGTKIDLQKEGLIVMPLSSKTEAEQGLNPDQLKKIIWFDDKKFRSVDEALGWLVTTPEGKKLHKDLVKE